VACAFTVGLTDPTAIHAQEKAAFSYDPAEFPEAKPWTSENFKNNPDNFQFAIIGDRGGGANPQGTYQQAIEQLNWLHPEFVMSVGDYVEGYTSEPKVMNAQWDEFDGIVNKLQMPFFYVRGNHDINTPITREAWAQKRGPKYYHFKVHPAEAYCGLKKCGHAVPICCSCKDFRQEKAACPQACCTMRSGCATTVT
jgi:pimeloyl-ACP methyl ester carboxylesterase